MLKKFVIILVFGGTLICFYNMFINNEIIIARDDGIRKNMQDNRIERHTKIIYDYFMQRETWKTSNLGSLLFYKDISGVHAPKPIIDDNKKFLVLIWKYGHILKNRHIYNYGTEKKDPLEGCSVSNCEFTYEDKYLDTADAVVVQLQRAQLPITKNRSPNQRWIFLTDEAPTHTFLNSANWRDFADVFNWSMSYRTESDIPVPYGRTVPLAKPLGSSDELEALTIKNLVPHWRNKKTDVPAAILISNCGGERMNFIKRLRKQLDIDVYGSCFPNQEVCQGHFRKDCEIIDKYFFYLAFENSQCYDYLTEKVFHNAYSKGAIPVVIGPDRSCRENLPPNSFIYVHSYKANVTELAHKIKTLMKNRDKLLDFHKWRLNFEVKEEHGYFKTRSVHYCRVCEGLNYNDKSHKVYDEEALGTYLDREISCYDYLKDKDNLAMWMEPSKIMIY